MNKIILGAVAYDPKVVTIWEGIKDYFLSEKVNFDFVLFSNYEEQVQFLLERKIDIAWNTPLGHVRVQHKTKNQSISLGMRDSDQNFHSRLIIPKNSSIQKIKDVEGKKIGVGSQDSTQAKILPLYFLKTQGVDLSKVNLVPFNSDVGKHGDTGKSELEVLAAIDHGIIDGGVLGDLVWVTESSRSNLGTGNMKSVWVSPPFDHCMFDAMPALAPEKIKAFQTTLFNMKWENPTHRKLLEMEGLREWKLPREEGYESLRSALKDLGEMV